MAVGVPVAQVPASQQVALAPLDSAEGRLARDPPPLVGQAQPLHQARGRGQSGHRVYDAEGASGHAPSPPRAVPPPVRPSAEATPRRRKGRRRARRRPRRGSPRKSRRPPGASTSTLSTHSINSSSLCSMMTMVCRPSAARRRRRREELGGGSWVEIGRRLVQHQHARSHGQAPRPGPLAASHPPRGWPGAAADTRSRPTEPRAWSMAASISSGDRRRFSRPKAISSSTVSVQNWASGSWKTSPVSCASRCTGTVAHHQPGHHHLAGVVALDQVRDQTVQAQGERALARPARPQHQHGLARADTRRRDRPARA